MKKTIQNHFDQYRLTEEQLSRLNEIQSRSASPRLASFFKMRRFSAALVSLAALLAVGTMAWWQPWNHATSIASLASEIAYHHNKQMTMEVESSSLEEVRSYLAKLDFPLIESEQLPSSDWELVGGRYCSLKGHIAAQLRMREKSTGKTVTFYQLLMPKEISGFQDAFEIFDQGVKVKLWKERGLLLSVARDE